MGKVRIQGQTREIDTSASKLGKGSASFFLGFNRYRLAEREYIILYEQNYNLFLRTYAKSFALATQQNINIDARNGINTYLNRIKGLSKTNSGSSKANTANLIQQTANMAQFEHEFFKMFVEGAQSGLFAGINSNTAVLKVARSALAKSLPGNDTIYSQNAQLDKFFSIYWHVLDDVTKSRQATAAFKTILANWRMTGKATYSETILNESDMLALTHAMELLNRITTMFDSLLGTVKTYKTKAAVVRTAHMASNDIIGMMESALSGTGGNLGEEAAVKMINRVTGADVPKYLQDIAKNVNLKASTNGFQISAAPGQLAQRTGSLKQEENNATVKTDVSSSWLNVTMGQGNNANSFLAKVNVNVKSYPSLSGMTSKDIADYGRTPKKMIKIQEKSGILDYLQQFSPATARFYAENVLVHSGDNSSHMRLVKQSITSKFFVDWLAGTGNRISGSDEIDVSNFMMVNGHLFSMYDVLQEVVRSFNEDGTRSAINISISGRTALTTANKKVNPKTNSYAQGFIRSKTVIGAMKNLTLIARMNPAVFFKIAQSYNIPHFVL